MTRENKLALIVGFGLILFVGILISDHFSAVRSQSAANLAAVNDPLATRSHFEHAELVDLQSRLNPRADVDAMENEARYDEPLDLSSEQSTSRQLLLFKSPTNSSTATSVARTIQDNLRNVKIPGFTFTEDPAVAQVDVTAHIVTKGETLYAICKQYYGTPSVVNDLAEFNGLDNASALKVGQKIRVPEPGEFGLKSVKKSSKKRQTYEVKPGDSLSEIAQKYLGSASSWKKLLELNRDLIDDPDRVKVGTVLRLN